MVTVRNLPRWQIVSRLKRRGITQSEIARRAKVSQGFVSHVIARQMSRGAKAAEVWRVLEEVLNGQ